MFEQHIYLDMDGVLCDLHKALLALHNRTDLLETIPSHDLEDCLELTNEEIWSPVVDAGWEFWADLEAYPWAFELWAWAHEVGDTVHVLSRPLQLGQLDSRDIGYCLWGKMVWIRRHFGRKFRKVIFTPDKYAVSGPGVILIDDDERHEAEFNRRGGRQIVFPPAVQSVS